MSAKQVVPGLYELNLGMVNAFLLEADDGLTLVDTGQHADAQRLIRAVRSLGHRVEDLRRIVVTHCHYDHSAGLAALKRLSRAQAFMHPTDAALVRAGECLRPLTPAPWWMNRLVFALVVSRAPNTIAAAEVDQELADGQVLPIAGGLQVIHAPGHCAGQVALLWRQHGGVLLAADTCANAFGLTLSPGYEDLDLGRASLRKIAALDFEVACFGHGRAIKQHAARKFRERFAG